MEALLDQLLNIGELLLQNGAEISRVEETISRMGMAYGAAEMQVFVITYSIVVSMKLSDGRVLTQTRRITRPAGTDFLRLEACNALSVSLLNHSKDPITHFNDLGIYRILFDYKNREELYQFYRETVGVIIEYDRQNQTEYLNTIRTYISQNCSTNNTAKKLFVHYNTIRYRINKIQKLFGMDLDNEEDRINLHVGIKVADSLDLRKAF